MTKNELLDFSMSKGISLLGVASPDRFKNLSAQGNPLSILPEAKSIITLAVEIPRGQYRGIEEGTCWTFVTPTVSTSILYDICRYIEKEGYEAVPVVTNKTDFIPHTKPVKSERPIPNVLPPIEYAAVACGLGEIGFCRLLLTPQYGSRQALGMIITELELPQDPIFDGKICDCAKCAVCARSCPLHAIQPDNSTIIEVCGKKMELANINYNLCKICPNGAIPDYSYKVGMEEMITEASVTRIQNKDKAVASFRSIPNIHTALCNRACINYLDDTGRLNKKYKNRFKSETPWKLDFEG